LDEGDKIRLSLLIFFKGSYECRAGWSLEKEPRLRFRSLIGRERGTKDSYGRPIMYVGNDIQADVFPKVNLRSAFEENIVTQFDYQERVFDYIFQHLAIDGDAVDHPLLFTEPIANPNYCRSSEFTIT